MFKKAVILAVLALAGSAISVGREKTKNAKRSVRGIMTAQIQSVLPARDRNSTCRVLTCAKKGERCSDHSECQFTTGCLDGICRHSVEGDACDDSDCFGLTLYCSDATDTCTPYQKYGDVCDGKCKAGTHKYYCNATLGGVCKYRPQREGDECDEASAELCPAQTFCTASSSAPIGVCKGLPSKAGEKCAESGACSEEKSLYCSGETLTCVEYPKAGAECYGEGHRCFAGLYCNRSSSGAGVCTPLKKPGEDCEKSYECPAGYKCAENKRCMKDNPGAGEYCDDDVECDNEDYFMCYDNVCTKRGEHCEEPDDCPYSYIYDCRDEKCVGRMTLKEGEECYIDFDHYDDDDDDTTPVEVFYALTSLQCEEGLVCVPKARGLSKGACKKPSTTVAANISCATDAECPLDSVCRCNDQTGDVQCIPLPPSSGELLRRYEKAADTIVACKRAHEGDIEYEEKVAQCCLADVNELVEFVGKEVYPYSSEYRCLDFSLLGAASTAKVSLVALFATLLLSLLL